MVNGKALNKLEYYLSGRYQTIIWVIVCSPFSLLKPPSPQDKFLVIRKCKHVNDGFNVWNRWRSHFRPKGPTFISLSTDEASVVKCSLPHILLHLVMWSLDTQFLIISVLMISSYFSPFHQETLRRSTLSSVADSQFNTASLLDE